MDFPRTFVMLAFFLSIACSATTDTATRPRWLPGRLWDSVRAHASTRLRARLARSNRTADAPPEAQPLSSWADVREAFGSTDGAVAQARHRLRRRNAMSNLFEMDGAAIHQVHAMAARPHPEVVKRVTVRRENGQAGFQLLLLSDREDLPVRVTYPEGRGYFNQLLGNQGVRNHMRILRVGEHGPINTGEQWGAAMEAVNGRGDDAEFTMLLAERDDELYAEQPEADEDLFAPAERRAFYDHQQRREVRAAARELERAEEEAERRLYELRNRADAAALALAALPIFQDRPLALPLRPEDAFQGGPRALPLEQQFTVESGNVTARTLTADDVPSEQCVFCLDDFKEGEVVHETGCGHSFHGVCPSDASLGLSAWHGTCPTCRHTAPPNNLARELCPQGHRLARVNQRRLETWGAACRGPAPCCAICSKSTEQAASPTTLGSAWRCAECDYDKCLRCGPCEPPVADQAVSESPRVVWRGETMRLE